MKEEITTIRGDFLNEGQKKVKEDIMEELINVMPKHLINNIHLFREAMNVSDLTLSIMIMFNREMFYNIFVGSNAGKQWKQLFRAICNEIENEIQSKMDENIDKPH